MSALDRDIDQLAFIVELQQARRSRTWTLVGVLLEEADAVYLATTYRDHDARRARVVAISDGSIVLDTKWPPR